MGATSMFLEGFDKASLNAVIKDTLRADESALFSYPLHFSDG